MFQTAEFLILKENNRNGFLDFMAALSAHLPGSLALWCFIAFMHAMY